jgi:PleD family two-component response regulator
VSVGVATYDPARPAHDDIAALMRAADAALYHAKESGRNCVKAA